MPCKRALVGRMIFWDNYFLILFILMGTGYFFQPNKDLKDEKDEQDVFLIFFYPAFILPILFILVKFSA